MVHTIIEVMRMDKKFIAAVAVCFVALVGVATGTYFLGQKSDENIVKLGKANITETTAADKNIEAAGNVVEKETQKETAMESETPKDREVEPGGYLTEETTKEKAVNNVVEENTQSNVSKKDYLYGLSSEAAAQIKTLKFNKNSKLIWPVEGSIIMPYDVKNTVYYATLDEYKTNPGIVIQSSKGTAIKAAADGVITKITQDDELGVVISQAVGNDYIVNYGQTINPEVKEGSFVEAGQTIAYVNQPTKYYSKEGDNIYFSVERNGKTKDPLNYIDYED